MHLQFLCSYSGMTCPHETAHHPGLPSLEFCRIVTGHNLLGVRGRFQSSACTRELNFLGCSAIQLQSYPSGWESSGLFSYPATVTLVRNRLPQTSTIHGLTLVTGNFRMKSNGSEKGTHCMPAFQRVGACSTRAHTKQQVLPIAS